MTNGPAGIREFTDAFFTDGNALVQAYSNDCRVALHTKTALLQVTSQMMIVSLSKSSPAAVRRYSVMIPDHPGLERYSAPAHRQQCQWGNLGLGLSCVGTAVDCTLTMPSMGRRAAALRSFRLEQRRAAAMRPLRRCPCKPPIEKIQRKATHWKSVRKFNSVRKKISGSVTNGPAADAEHEINCARPYRPGSSVPTGG